LAQPRRVDWRRAFAWYGDALRWLKLSPVMLLVLAFLTLATEYVLQQITGAGGLILSKVVTPLVACSLYVACDRVAAGGKARWSDLLAAFRVSAPSIAAIVVTSLVEFVAEAITADSLSGANLFVDDGSDDDALDLETIFIMLAVGFIVSLPFTLTPFFALLDDAGFAGSIRPSVRAFFANVPAFLCYGLLSYLLLTVGIALMGLGVIVAMPLWVAASYSALREIYPRGEAIADP
jgi:uncharacterized membrane protein